MDEKRRDLLMIGSFADSTRLSLKALRLYDQLGILKPAYIDRFTGYRYYAVSQLPAARRIRLMRLMQMPLASIRQVLALPPADAERLVEAHCQQLQAQADRARALAHDLIHALRGQEGLTTMAQEVQVSRVEAQPVLSITKRVHVAQLDACIVETLGSLRALAAAQGAVVSGPPFGIYHGRIDEEDDGPIEICLPVQHLLAQVPEGAASAAARQLPAARLAALTVTGADCDFPAILKAYDAVADFIYSSGFEPDGPPREVWIAPPGASAEMRIEWAFREREA